MEHLGSLRRALLDHLLDTAEAGPQSVAQILAAMPPGTTRGNVESAIKREFDAGRIERVAPGVYRLAPAPPAEAPKRASPPETDQVRSDQWYEWLDHWKATSEWRGPGAPPGQDGWEVPMDIIFRHSECVRKREQRRKDAEAAAAKQADADEKLRDQLLAVTGGNFMCGANVHGLDDLAPVRLMLQIFPIQHVLVGLKRAVGDRRAAPLETWRDERFLQAVADNYCRAVVIPSMVDAWSKATAKVPAKPV